MLRISKAVPSYIAEVTKDNQGFLSKHLWPPLVALFLFIPLGGKGGKIFGFFFLKIFLLLIWFISRTTRLFISRTTLFISRTTRLYR